jgi:uridine kinase
MLSNTLSLPPPRATTPPATPGIRFDEGTDGRCTALIRVPDPFKKYTHIFNFPHRSQVHPEPRSPSGYIHTFQHGSSAGSSSNLAPPAMAEPGVQCVDISASSSDIPLQVSSAAHSSDDDWGDWKASPRATANTLGSIQVAPPAPVANPSQMFSALTRANAVRNIRFVAITGTAGAGKTTLSRSLAEAFNSPFIPLCVDWVFFLRRCPLVDGSRQWASLQGFDQALFATILSRMADSVVPGTTIPTTLPYGKHNMVRAQRANTPTRDTEYIILEGVSLLAWEDMAQTVDYCIKLQAPPETAVERIEMRRRKGKGHPYESRLEQYKINQGRMQAENENKESAALTLAGTAFRDRHRYKVAGQSLARSKLPPHGPFRGTNFASSQARPHT